MKPFPEFNQLLISLWIQFGLLLPFQNIRTLPHFRMIYCLPLKMSPAF